MQAQTLNLSIRDAVALPLKGTWRVFQINCSHNSVHAHETKEQWIRNEQRKIKVTISTREKWPTVDSMGMHEDCRELYISIDEFLSLSDEETSIDLTGSIIPHPLNVLFANESSHLYNAFRLAHTKFSKLIGVLREEIPTMKEELT